VTPFQGVRERSSPDKGIAYLTDTGKTIR